MPEICPVLALALYLSYFGDGSTKQLFPGENQGHRFSGLFDKLLKACDTLLLGHGHDGHRDLGTQSIRKGAVAFTLGGSTVGPGVFSVTLRAQWKKGLVQETQYIKYEAAADQYCGRTVAGLDLQSENFSVLPPHFGTDDIVADSALSTVFGTTLALSGPRPLHRVLNGCLASLVHHHTWLGTILPRNSPLRHCALFSDDATYQRLKDRVITGLSSPHMVTTGIPPHISQIKLLKKMEERLEGVSRTVAGSAETIAGTVVDGVADILERRAIDAGEMTPDAVRRQILAGSQEVLDEMRALLQLAQAEARPPAPEQAASSSATTAGASDAATLGSPTVYHWGGGYRLVPEGWTLPSLNTAAAWRLWTLGEPASRVPPLRALTAKDIGPGMQVQRRFSEWKGLFTWAERFLEARGRFCSGSGVDASSAGMMFEELTPFLESQCSGKRPCSVLAVGTVARKFRRYDQETFEQYLQTLEPNASD